jgi:hypothetical protein
LLAIEVNVIDHQVVVSLQKRKDDQSLRRMMMFEQYQPTVNDNLGNVHNDGSLRIPSFALEALSGPLPEF